MTTVKKKRLSIADKDAILTHYNNGLNGKEISDIMTGQVTYGQVNHYLKKVKHRRGGVSAEKKALEKKALTTRPNYSSWNRKPPAPEVIAKIQALHKQGMSFIAIAKECGVSVNTANRYSNPEYRKNSKRRANAFTPKTAPKTVTPNLSSLIDELRAEIRAELKAELLKEMLGKK